MNGLPDELWREIFDYAAEDGPTLVRTLNDSMDDSIWYKMIFGEWWLRSPEESLKMHQRRTYSTKKAIFRTCKKWRQLGAEFLFRCILVGDPLHLQKLCAIFDRESQLGWWTRRIHVYQDHRGSGRDVNVSDLEDGLASLIQHCPNLEIFIMESRMDCAFVTVAETLCTFCPKTLRAIRFTVPHEAQPKVISVVDSLRYLTSALIEFSPAMRESERTLSGAGAFLEVSLPFLRELSLRGSIQDFVEQVATWNLPELTNLTFDFGTNRHDFPDIIDCLSTHGPQLTSLDLSSIPTLDVPAILSICTNLISFSFNLDWALGGGITTIPHERIERIGLHGLRHAFGVGFAAVYASVQPFEAALMRRCNDANFTALTKRQFPALRVVRVLDPGLLKDLNTANGPPEGPFYERWERWWDQCAAQRIRLEDCAGNPLGTLPQEQESDISSDLDSQECDLYEEEAQELDNYLVLT